MTGTHKIDPRTKLFLIACLSSMAVILSEPWFLLGIFAGSVILALLFRAGLMSVFKKAKWLLAMVLFIAVIQSVFTPGGRALLSVGGLGLLTEEGLRLGAEFILRMLIIITSAGILATADSREIIQGLVQWKLPYEIAFMASMGIRFLPSLTEEFRNAMVALQLRGVDFKRLRFKQKLEIYTCLFQPVVAAAIIKSKKISMSIEMRGFREYPVRTSYLVLCLSPADYAILVLSGAATVGMFLFYFIFF